MTDEGTVLKYPRLNLNIGVNNTVLGNSNTILKCSRHQNQFWYDVVSIVIRFFQLSGIVWILGGYYRWPESWMKAVSWIAFFNLDLYTFLEYHEVGYFSQTIHNILVLAGAWVGIVILYIIFSTFKRDPKSHLLLSAPQTFLSYVALGYDLYYIPACLAFFRLLACGDSRGVNLFSASAECADTTHIVQIIIAVVLGIPFLFVIPLVYHNWLAQHILHKDEFDHMFYIHARETEYALGLNDMYEVHHMYLYSAVHRSYVNYRQWYFPMYFLAVGFAILFGPTVTLKQHYMLIGAVFSTVFMFVPCVMRIISTKYRARETNILCMIMDFTIFILNICSIVTSDNPSSSISSEDNMQIPLFVIWFLGLVGLLFVLVKAIISGVEWSVNEKNLIDIAIGNSALLFTLNSSQVLLEECLFTPAEFFPKHKITNLLHFLHQYYERFSNQLVGMREGTYRKPKKHFPLHYMSIDPRIAHEANDERFDYGVNLLYTIEDTIEDLMHLYSALRHTLSAFSDGTTTDDSMKRMKEILAGFGKSLKQKKFDRLLMKPEKTMLLRKMLILRNVLGDDFVRNSKNTSRIIHESSIVPGNFGLTNMQYRSRSRSPPSEKEQGSDNELFVAAGSMNFSQLRIPDDSESQDEDEEGDHIGTLLGNNNLQHSDDDDEEDDSFGAYHGAAGQFPDESFIDPNAVTRTDVMMMDLSKQPSNGTKQPLNSSEPHYTLSNTGFALDNSEHEDEEDAEEKEDDGIEYVGSEDDDASSGDDEQADLLAKKSPFLDASTITPLPPQSKMFGSDTEEEDEDYFDEDDE